MKTEGYYQCCSCGTVHYIKYPYKANDLYSTLWCNECEDEENHLWVGDTMDDIYIYYDVTKDERYFIYD